MNAPTTRAETGFRIELERRIDAPIDAVFDAVLEETGPGFETPDGQPLSLKLEAFPGGRWYRDMGNDEGHYWGTVQAIRRPDLLELRGPIFMSEPVMNNVQYRLTEEDGVTVLRMVHVAFGPVTEEAMDNMPHGWNHQLDKIAAKGAGA